MKRSKAFLGITTFSLAIAGVASTKVHKFNNTKNGYFGTRAATCVHFSKAFYTEGTKQAITVYNTGGYLVWTRSSTVQACADIPDNHKLWYNHVVEN
jgi:hypothetical protein